MLLGNRKISSSQGGESRKLTANRGSIEMADIPNPGIAEGGENDRRHGFFYRRQRFRSAAEEKQSGNGDECPDCRYGNGWSR